MSVVRYDANPNLPFSTLNCEHIGERGILFLDVKKKREIIPSLHSVYLLFSCIFQHQLHTNKQVPQFFQKTKINQNDKISGIITKSFSEELSIHHQHFTFKKI